jgi:hypothetical protein
MAPVRTLTFPELLPPLNWPSLIARHFPHAWSLEQPLALYILPDLVSHPMLFRVQMLLQVQELIKIFIIV